MATSLFLSLIISGLLGWLAAYWFSSNIYNHLLHKKSSLAIFIGQFAAKHINLDSLQHKLGDPGLLSDAMPTIEKHIDEFLNVKLKEEIPMIGMFIGNKTTDQLKAVFIKQLQTLFPEIMQQFGGKLFSSLDLTQMVSQKINAIPDAEFKTMLQQPLQKPFNLLRWGGLITGVIIGAVNFLLLYFL